MGVADQAGKALAALATAVSTSAWVDSGTREMTLPSLGLWTSRKAPAASTNEPST